MVFSIPAPESGCHATLRARVISRICSGILRTSRRLADRAKHKQTPVSSGGAMHLSNILVHVGPSARNWHLPFTKFCKPQAR